MLKFHLNLPRRYFQMNVDFTVPNGNIYCLYGPSAAGKSSILSVIAGFETGYDNVRLELDGVVLLESGSGPASNAKTKHFTPAWRRKIGYLAQSVPLFPHLSVKDNIRFGLDELQRRDSDMTGVDAEAWYEEVVRLLELAPYLAMRPQQLSGGLTQRAALARALVPRPRLLLLDEPFSALDWESRNHMQDVVLDLHRRMDLTTVLVTHQLEEAQRMADIVGVLDEGRILQEASPSALMAAPRDWNVARRLGYQQIWQERGKYYALHPDRGVVVPSDHHVKYADLESVGDSESVHSGLGSADSTFGSFASALGSLESMVKIDGIVQGIVLKDGRRLAQLSVNDYDSRGQHGSSHKSPHKPDGFIVTVALSPLQSVSAGDTVTAVFIAPPELNDVSAENDV